MNEIHLIKDKFDKTIIARDTQIKAVKECFDFVDQGESAVCAIAGNPGVGKTFLVENVIKDIGFNRVTYICGKFKQNDNKPLNTISEIIEQMVKHLLTLSPNQLNNTKNILEKELGTNIGIITSMCPYSKKLLGHHKPINIEYYEKLKYRIINTCNDFISTVSNVLFPLVLFVDDIQWADKLSLNILKILSKDIEFLNMLLIVAYRDNEKKSIKKVEELIKNIQKEKNHRIINLSLFTENDIKDYLEIFFDNDLENYEYFSRIIYSLSLGNPFYIREIISLFIEEKIFVFSKQQLKWTGDIKHINDFHLPSDIEQIIINQINSLDINEQNILNIIACLNGNIQYQILKKAIGVNEDVLIDKLQMFCNVNILVDNVKDYNDEKVLFYSFLHDIILELVYNNIHQQEKTNIHYKMMKLVIEDEDIEFIENKRLFIASQLLHLDYSCFSGENLDKWIYEFYYAGLELKRTAAIKQALKIFDICYNLYKNHSLEKNNELHMNINLELAECQFICRRYNDAEKVFEELISKHNKIDDIIKIKVKYMELYSYSGDSEKVIELGTEVLNHLNYKFSTRQLMTDLMRVRLLFTNKKIDNLKKQKYIKDKRLLMILQVLSKMIPAANCLNDKIFQILLIKIALITIKHGYSKYSPIGYSTLSFFFYRVWKDPVKAQKLKEMTLESLNKTDEFLITAITHPFTGTFVYHWTHSLNHTIDYLEKYIEQGIYNGEYLYTGYSVVSVIYAKYIMGIPLTELAEYACDRLKTLENLGNNPLIFIERVIISHINFVEKGVAISLSIDEIKEIESIDNNISLVYNTFYIQRLYLEGKINKAFTLVKKIKPIIHYLKGHIVYPEILFYALIIRLTYHKSLSKPGKKKNKVLIKKYIKELEYINSVSNENHHARYLLVKALYFGCFRKGETLDILYNKAIDIAKTKGQIQVEAIGNLLAANYYKDCNKLCRFYASDAVSKLKQWGAYYIADVVKKKFELEADKNLSKVDNSSQKKDYRKEEQKEETDIISHLNNIEGMDEEEAYISTLDFLTRNSFADYTAIMFEQSDDMCLKYEKKISENVIIYNEMKAINHIDNISHRIIRYVARTGEEVILTQKPTSGLWTKDLHIMNAKHISILCIPIKYLGVLTGMVYMEKLTDNGFSDSIAKNIKAILPSIISKMKTIKDINLVSLLESKKTVSPLTDRELEVLQHVAEGLSNSDISKELYITLGTVRNHLSNIYAKLEVDSRIKAVIKAKELRLIV